MVIKKTYTPRPSRPTPPPSPSPVVATVEAAEAVRNVVPPARDARLPKESANLQDGVIPSPLGRSSNGDDAARLGHSEVPVQEVTPDTNQSPAKKRKKKSKRAKKERKAKNQNLESSSTLGRSSDGDDAARLGHSGVSEALTQEVTPVVNEGSSKSEAKTKRAKKKHKTKSQNLESSSTLGRSSDGDNAARLGHSGVSEDPVQEPAPVKEQNSPGQHHENLTQPESLNITSLPDENTPAKDGRRPKTFKKIKKRLKRFGKKTRKKFEKEFSIILVNALLSLLLLFFPHLSNNTIDSGVPKNLQRQGQVTNVMICPPLESASPVAVTPNQSVSKTGNTHMQVNQACYYVVQQ